MQTKTTRRRAALYFCAAVSAVVLSACGGGGGGDSGSNNGAGDVSGTAVITSSNYVSVAQQAVTSATFMVNGASLITGAQTADPQRALAHEALQQALRLRQWFTQAPAAVVGGATQSQTENCDGGGTLTASLNDLNGNQDLDSGDSATLQFSNCVELGVTINGGMQLNATQVSGNFDSDVYSATVAVTFNNLSVGVGSGASVTGSGKMTIGISATGANASQLTIDAPSFTESGSVGGTSVSLSMTGYRLSVVTQTSGGNVTTSSSIDGSLSTSTLGSQQIQITTLSPLTTVAGQSYPSSGQMLVKGGKGSQVMVTVQSGGMVQIQLDADGDGSFETSTTQSWSSLN